MGCRLSGLLVEDGTGIDGRDLSQVYRRGMPHPLVGCEQPITLQVEGRRGGRRQSSRQTSDCSTQTERSWDALRCLAVTAESGSGIHEYKDRRCCNHMTPSHDRYMASHYLPSIPHNTEDMNRLGYKDPGLPSCAPKRRSCLIGCCNTNMDEPNGFLSQTEDEDLVLEKPLAYLPLMHELDSGLGCTDGSFHQGELSGPETEDGVEEPVSSPPGRTSRGSSPSSESLISSELSDSGFYSVSTGEFRRFQRLLEKKIRLYRARMIPRDQREGLKARWDLESIPEALACQPQDDWSPEASPACLAHQCNPGAFRKTGGPCMSRYSSSTGSVFSPQVRPSNCSTLACQRRGRLFHQNSSAEYMWRSHTVHRPGPQVLERRRASHPASPHYRSAVVHHCREFGTGLSPNRDLLPGNQMCHEAGLWRQGAQEENRNIFPRELYSNKDHSLNVVEKQDAVFNQGPLERKREQCLRTLGHSQDVHETWPKSASRCSPRQGLYNTLDSHSPGSRKGLSGNPRAQRNQLLKARASRLADERSEVTTDEEARGEVKTGRYWSKAERRRHLLLAREQRQRRLARGIPSGGSSAGGEVVGSNAAGRSALLELSQRKLSRLRNRKLLDDWTTVEELLTHGTRVCGPEQVQMPSPLLSVTTV